MKHLKIAYNSFLWALVVALTCFKSEWLEMRVNTGYILFGGLAAMFIAISLFSRRRAAGPGFRFTLINLAACFLYSFILYGAHRLTVVPAAMIREGLHMSGAGFALINSILGALLLIGLAAIAGEEYVRRVKVKP